jgi:3-methyladenine DNA glycosylase AlkD
VNGGVEPVIIVGDQLGGKVVVMASVESILDQLAAQAKPDQLAGMARYGMTGEKRLGVSVADLRTIARATGKNHDLAQELWRTGIPEARILASMIDLPDQVTEGQMEAWVGEFQAWDVCDQVCMNLFERTPLAWTKIHDWSVREEEFVKRAAFALIACLAWHNKTATDEQFIALLPLIRAGASDGRNMVKKAVSWALRNIGKRNQTLHAAGLRTAHELRDCEPPNPTRRWIAADVIRDLNSEPTKRRLGLKDE